MDRRPLNSGCARASQRGYDRVERRPVSCLAGLRVGVGVDHDTVSVDVPDLAHRQAGASHDLAVRGELALRVLGRRADLDGNHRT